MNNGSCVCLVGEIVAGDDAPFECFWHIRSGDED